jgi:phage tail sheath gpL-like
MSSMVRIDLTIPSNEATYIAKTLPINTDGHRSFVNISTYMAAIAGGVYSGKIHEVTGAVQSSGTLTVSSTGPTNGQTGTVANQTITAETSGADPTMGQFNINASATVVATNIALAINSTPAIAAMVTATSALGVVTITAKAPGVVGNGFELSAGNLSNVVAVAFSGGTDGHTFDFNVGQA